jgi:hypothetical protein
MRNIVILLFAILLEGRAAVENGTAWFAFAPKEDSSSAASAIDLRFLNERFAGENGFIAVKNGQFVHSKTAEAVRFWAVNGPPQKLNGADLKRAARMLAKYGVNLVRIHSGLFDVNGAVDSEKVKHSLEIVAAMKAEGIYSHFSIYFPLWFKPRADNPFLKGYDGNKVPFAVLFFNEGFQEQYRNWWRALLTTQSASSGKRLVDEPAVAGLEIQNEDSFFFWTFAANNLPSEQWEILEKKFGIWLQKKHGSIENAFTKWRVAPAKNDRVAEGRVGFRPLWNLFNEKTARDQETVQFLLETQMNFYAGTYDFLHSLGFKGVITASNWATASPEVFGPIEKWSYTATDFIDRHGYFGCNHKGPNSEWSIREGHTYSDRSALRFDAESPGKPKLFLHPGMDVHYQGKPSMISETTWTRPNRYRSEAPIYLAAYGALQGSDAIVHFADDGTDWSVKPNYWMQPWTLGSPAMMGQFPAAALIFRKGLIKAGDTVAKVNLNTNDLLDLKGTPLPQDAALDELRLKDVPRAGEIKGGQRIDPLVHFVGRTEVRFGSGATEARVPDLGKFIDRDRRSVISSTGELKLDYDHGVLILNAPRAQGVSGNAIAAGTVETADLKVISPLDLVHIVLVSLDDEPLSKSRKMLLQVMSEEQNGGFETEEISPGVKKILRLGTDPWQVKKIKGEVSFKSGQPVKITPLDFNGFPAGKQLSTAELTLLPETIYYLVTK